MFPLAEVRYATTHHVGAVMDEYWELDPDLATASPGVRMHSPAGWGDYGDGFWRAMTGT